MSNELANIIGSSELVELGLDEDTLAVAGNATKGNKRISIDGRVFRKFVGGKEQSVNADNSMNVIFVKMAHEASRTFYNSTYKKGVKISPVCWSNDSKTPDPEVKSPCASTCAECPNSVKGSGQGGVGTACRLSWRTAVVLPNDPAGDVYQLVLPPTSAFGKEDAGRWPFRPYVQMLANNNVSAGRVVTKMQFDINSSTPKLLFSPVSAVPAEMREVITRQGKTPAAENAIKLTVFKTDNGASEEGEAPAQQAPMAAEAEAEPIKRETARASAAPADDVQDVLKKWSKK
jgi:hypothetical protein